MTHDPTQRDGNHRVLACRHRLAYIWSSVVNPGKRPQTVCVRSVSRTPQCAHTVWGKKHTAYGKSRTSHVTRCDLSEREQSGSRSSQTADGGVYIQGGFSINVIKQDAHFLNVKINQHIVDIGASGLYPRPSIMGVVSIHGLDSLGIDQILVMG